MSSDSLFSTVNSYKIIATLDRHEKSRVFKAIDLRNGDKVAIKRIKRNSSDTILADSLQIQTELNSSGIISVISKFSDQDFHYIVYPYAQSGDLYFYVVDNGPMQIKDAQSIMYKLAKVVLYLHGCHIIHNSIRLESILLTNMPGDMFSIQLSGFGRAMRASNEHGFRPLAPNPVDPYVAPEYKISKIPTYESDMYSLGITYYTLLAGFSPGSLKQNRFDSSLWENDDLRNLIMGLLDPNPAKRLTADQVLNHKFFYAAREAEAKAAWEIDLNRMIRELSENTNQNYSQDEDADIDPVY